ncbi:MAG: threonine/serine exporter family protein [Lachnospiraceae bacterium]|nr:threonine/serine exporter family protein [Lachnospiraceae bacterium]
MTEQNKYTDTVYTSTDSQRLDHREVLDAAMLAGNILLQNGAEIYRVEETVHRICEAFGVESLDTFVLTNGIFMTAGNEQEKRFARVNYIPVKGAQLHRIVAVNQLSREIEEGKYTVEQVKERLEDIRTAPGYSNRTKIFAVALTSFSFCFMFGGNWMEALVSFVIGIVLGFYIYYVGGRFSKIMSNIGGGAVITLVAILALQLRIPVPMELSHLIVGPLMPLVPGLAFTNGIRDITNGDYLSGPVRMIDSIMVFISIAAGVGVVLAIYNMVTGGVLI